MTTQATQQPAAHAVGDDTQRALLRCVLTDACAHLEEILDSCASCAESEQAPRYTECQDHSAVMPSIREQVALDRELETGCATSAPRALSAAQLAVLADALPQAAAYRRSRHAAEDKALRAAYSELGGFLLASDTRGSQAAGGPPESSR